MNLNAEFVSVVFMHREKKEHRKNGVREHFVMTDKEGTVFHFIVEGTAISDVTKIPPEVRIKILLCDVVAEEVGVRLAKASAQKERIHQRVLLKEAKMHHEK